ncbi:MAG: ABC transporter permease, partial [Actinomycetota bacterium]|nr:ABC transporter permease [Actinomycetota bacterium]
MSLATATPPPADPGTAVVVPPTTRTNVPGPLRFLTRAFRTLWSNGKARIGIVILGLIILVAILAPLIAPHSPTATSFQPYQGPGGTNWFGTTGNGQDVFSQVVYGARVSLIVGLVAGAAATFVAVTIGLISGYR